MTFGIWLTRDGLRIPVRQMTDTHLCNTLRYLARRALAIRKQEGRVVYRNGTRYPVASDGYSVAQQIAEMLDPTGEVAAREFWPEDFAMLLQEAVRRELNWRTYE